MKKNNGFTLSEMLVVIAIIAIIAVIAIPSVIVINNNINKRLLNEKRDQIISSAELFASDNPDIFNGRSEVKVYVSELINANYFTHEVEIGTGKCNADTANGTTIGCVINPVEKTSMNHEFIILRKETVGVVGEYCTDSSSSESCKTSIATDTEETLVDIVCERLSNGKEKESGTKQFIGKDLNGNACDCTDIESGDIDVCLITGSDVDNYLRYDNIMWRVMGIYDIYNDNERLSAKMINDDNVEITVD